MKKSITTLLIASLFASASFAADTDATTKEGYFANVDASFTAMLGHEPYAGATETTVALGIKDPIEISLHSPSAGEHTSDAGYFANVRDSFERDLNHAPYTGPSANMAAARQQRDPLETAWNELIDSHGNPDTRLAHNESSASPLSSHEVKAN